MQEWEEARRSARDRHDRADGAPDDVKGYDAMLGKIAPSLQNTPGRRSNGSASTGRFRPGISAPLGCYARTRSPDLEVAQRRVDAAKQSLYLADRSKGSHVRSTRRPTGRVSKRNASADTAKAPAERAGNGRLGRRDWIRTGQDILRENGVAGVKLAPLTRRLGVSTGSFYHHFADFDEYLGAVADAYSLDRVQGLLDRARDAGGDPVGRIRALARLSLDDHTFDLDRAMRTWATMDERASVNMRRAEERVLAFLAEAFRDLGFGTAEAALRARILLSVNVMPLSMDDPKMRRNFFKGALQLLAMPGS